MRYVRDEIHSDSFFYWRSGDTFCAHGCDPIVSFLQDTSPYIIGLKICVMLGTTIIVLGFLYYVACAYWAYVEESKDFKVLSFSMNYWDAAKYCERCIGSEVRPAGFSEFLWEPFHHRETHSVYLGLGTLIVVVGFVWPLAVLYFSVLSPAYIHRAIRRIQKRVDKLERK